MGNVKTLTSSVTSLKKELSGVYDVLKKIKGLGPSAFGDVNAVLSKSGQFGNGQGTPVFGKTAINGAPKFSNQTPMAAAKPASNAQQANYESTSERINSAYLDVGIRQASFGKLAAGAQIATSIVGGFGSMLPDVGAVAQRAGSYYGSSNMLGGSNRTQNQLSTMAAMKGGITGPMGTAEAFGTFTNYSFMPGSSNMKMGLEQTSAAAKALNMDNAAASSAIGALSTGSMGAQLYQYGINQYDTKGNLRTPGAIAKDLMKNVFYAGKDVTKIGAEQFAKDSMGMNLDYQLSTMGITGETATLIKASMGQIASGKSGELKDMKTSDNPLNPFYRINDSEESLTQDSEKGLLKGAETAAAALEKLNKALEQTPELILQMKGALQTFNGTKSGSGLTSTITNVITGIGAWKAASAVKTALTAAKAGGAAATTTAAATAATSATAATTAAAATGATATAATAGTAAAAATAAATARAARLATLAKVAKGATVAGVVSMAGGYVGDKIKGDSEKGSLRSRAGNAAKWGATAFGATALINAIPGIGNVSSAAITALAATAGFIMGGPTDGFSSSAGSQVNSFTFSAGSKPMANGALAASMGSTSISKQMGAGFGAKDSSLTMVGALNYHTGQDTPMPTGTPVYARFPGKVVTRNLSRDLGIAVEVDHGDGYSSIYGHLNLKSVRSGQEIKVGDLIGKSGSTGNVRGPHLHFELRKGKVPTDPNGYYPATPGGDGKKNTSSSAAGGSPTASASPTAAAVGEGVRANAKEIHAWLMTQGLSHNGATGVVGNLIQESGLRTGAVGDGGTSFGIAQWHKGRGDALKKFAVSKGMSYLDIELQKMFLLKEMKTYGSMMKKLKDPNVSIMDAARVFMTDFERPKDQSDKAASTRASLGIGAMQGGPTDGFNTNVINAKPYEMSLPTARGKGTSQGDTNNIYVTLQIQQANQHEAEAFAKTLKKYLEKDNKLEKIGSN
jgi:murein DD-endopeptidase MepM/ murein hydrolase activator NlpD